MTRPDPKEPLRAEPVASPNDVAARPLAYASPWTNELPELHPEAEAAIANGAGPNGLRKFFREPADAGVYFARSMRRRYRAAWRSGHCVGCGRSTGRYVRVWWDVVVRPRVIELKHDRFGVVARTQTCHSICDACAARWFAASARLKRRGRLLAAVTGYGLLALLVLAVVATAGRQVFDGLPRARVSWTVFFLGTVFLVACGAAVLGLNDWRWRQAAPGALRRMLPSCVLRKHSVLRGRADGGAGRVTT